MNDKTWHKRMLWIRTLESKFSKAFDRATAGFNWQDKADFIELFTQYLEIMQRSQEYAAAFYAEKFMKGYKSKLLPATNEKLFTFFDKDLALVELEVINTETFNSLKEDQGLSDEEFEAYLENNIRYLKTKQYMHYIYAHAKEDNNKQESLEGEPLNVKISTKGRPSRSAGDNHTTLSQEQTALLIDYMKQSRIILNDEYLTNKAAGFAFNLLTGYSTESLRIKLNDRELQNISNIENARAIYSALQELMRRMDKEFKGMLSK